MTDGLQSNILIDSGDRSWWWKSCQQLKVGDQVELVVSRKDQPEDLETSQTEHCGTCTGHVDDITDDTIHLSLGLEDGLALDFKPGQAITFTTSQEGGVWTYEGVVTANHVIRLEISRPLTATRTQRRDFCRVPVEIDTRFARQSGKGESAFHRGMTRDLSGGGLSLAVNEDVAAGEQLRIELPLERGVVSVQGIVRRVLPERRRGYKCVLGVEFMELAQVDQDKIIRFIFNRQRKLRRERME